jgi:formylglycine-generating enzyme required for sulfatase activity
LALYSPPPVMPSSTGKPTVYVSSTYVDLKEHRAALKIALEKAGFDVECMEKYPAFDERPLDYCLADVAASDVYVLLMAHRYGYRPAKDNPENRSITHLEYQEAGRHPGKPRLAFTVNQDHPWPPRLVDDGEAKRDLMAFRAVVEERHGVSLFTTPDQLSTLVLQALQRLDLRPARDPGKRYYTPQELQTWVECHHSDLEKAFLTTPTVSQREVHVPLEVEFLPNGSGQAPAALLQPADVAPLLADGPARILLISGDGGAGKTSLAFAIARWWLKGEPGEVVRLPVLIETGLGEGETVAQKVRGWLGDHLGEPPGLELVEALLRGRRLVPILDHVSELAPAARQRLLAGLPPGLVLATSRSEEDSWTGRALSQIKPRPIALDRLQTFFVEYLKAGGRGELLRDDELVPAQNQLRRIVGDKPITALLAQMFIDDVIANRARGLLAGSVPQLMLSYVRRIDTPADPVQRQRAGLTIDRDLVQRALKRLALASHQQEGVDGEPAYQPREFSRGLAKATLMLAEPDGLAMTALKAEALLAYLSELRLLIHPGEDTSELRFPLDPLADYLAALARLEVLESFSRSAGQTVAWEGLLGALERRQAKGEDLSRARGFFLALRDAALERNGRGVPLAAPDRLAQLGGLNPEKERERLAEQRARKWMWELVVPVASERRDAISKLAAMAAAAEPEDRRAASVVATDRLSQVLANDALPAEEREEAAVALGLIGSETGVDALEKLARKGEQPAELRRAAVEALGLAAKRLGGKHSLLRERIEGLLEEHLRADALDLLVEGDEGWAEHDRRLPLLQGASRALQLAASAELPLLASGAGRRVPMLTLSAIKEGRGLRIRTEVVTPPVWKLPLPECPGLEPQQLELVVVPEDEYEIGSPKKEDGREIYIRFRQKCEGVNVEALRQVSLRAYALVRHPISQARWRAVAALPRLDRDISPTPASYEAKGLWEIHAQPGGLAVQSVSWYDCQEWLKRLNRWLQEKWLALGGIGEPPVFGLPSESQWEAACRAGSDTPFHFGDTLDTRWANYDGGYTYGCGRKGAYRQRPVPMGFFGLVNRWGLAEMHGQLLEWCADQWHRDPFPELQHQQRGWLGGGGIRKQGVFEGHAIERADPGLSQVPHEQEMRLLRGGSWLLDPVGARAAVRSSDLPGDLDATVGVRPGCFSPPGLFLYP